jgi:intein-encoded DNA endonuclease-like protein
LIKSIVGEIDPGRGWISFVEGFFDAEGCVKIIGGKERRTPSACLDFCNTDFGLVAIIQDALRGIGISSGVSTQQAKPPRKTCYHLRIYSKAGIARFLELIPTTKLTEAKKRKLSKVGSENGRKGKVPLLCDFP